MMDVVDCLQQHHIKPSLQRIAIMQYLLEHHTHPTVDEIYTALSQRIPTLSKTTVYNTLKLLTDQGAVTTLTIDERNTCYDAMTMAHGHFLCKECGHIYDLPEVETASIMPDSAMMDGHQVQEIHHYYKGICKQCMQHIRLENNTN